jgi:predicted nucleic acid-binding Zn ribbon protein
MPIYEYRCKKCGEEFERLERVSDKSYDKTKGHIRIDGTRCCGELDRLISVSTIKFKGSGFHVNDYPKGTVRG